MPVLRAAQAFLPVLLVVIRELLATCLLDPYAEAG
jgi:hypothetical protein